MSTRAWGQRPLRAALRAFSDRFCQKKLRNYRHRVASSACEPVSAALFLLPTSILVDRDQLTFGSGSNSTSTCPPPAPSSQPAPVPSHSSSESNHVYTCSCIGVLQTLFCVRVNGESRICYDQSHSASSLRRRAPDTKLHSSPNPLPETPLVLRK